MPDGVVFTSFGGEGRGPGPKPVLNLAGHTAFSAFTPGDGVDSDDEQGLWSEGSGILSVVARVGDPAPGISAPGAVLGSFSQPLALNDAGETAFISSMGKSRNGLWIENAGNLSLIVGLGMPAPGTSDGTEFTSAGRPALNSAGHAAFLGILAGADVDDGNFRGIWSQTSGGLVLVARTGSPAHGTSGNYAALGSPVLNAAGQLAFGGNLINTSAGHGRYEAIWSGSAGSPALIVQQANHPPGTPSGVEFHLFGAPALNAAGQTAFNATLSGGDVVDGVNDSGIWSQGPGNLELVVRAGDQAPGMPSGIDFLGFRELILNASGQTAFLATLTSIGPNGNDEGIWAERGGNLERVACAGCLAPDAPSGFAFSFFDLPALNAAGQVAFAAELSDDNGEFLQGIWATDSSGELQLVARTGTQLEVAPGEFRTVQAVSFAGGSGNSDGISSGFNDRGQLVFWASFTDDSSGVFVSNLVATPEPASFALLVAPAAALLATRRRPRNR
jgi:hypothetical protein